MPSRRAKRDIDAVRGHLHRHREDRNIYRSPVTASEDAQAFVTASLTQMLPETAAWGGALPAGTQNSPCTRRMKARE
ncbi:MAG TPA: hypothetical protein VGD84_16865 [Pseudonocardiaceae bacterium]